jgi:hypothetical protein
MMGEPEDGAAIMLFALGPPDDLIERERIENPVAPSRRIIQVPGIKDPPIRDERVSAALREHAFPWLER